MSPENKRFSGSGEELVSPEKTEQIPTEEEVRGILQEIIAGPYVESRKLEDGKGLYLLDVRVPGEEDGEVIEYSYMRAGRYPEGKHQIIKLIKLGFKTMLQLAESQLQNRSTVSGNSLIKIEKYLSVKLIS